MTGADRVVAVSSSLAELAVELGASADRVQVIGNGIDPRRFQLPDEDRRRACRAALDVRDDARVLLTVGGLVERKGVGRVIDVLPRVLERYPEVVYLVAGGGGPEGDERQALQRRAAEHGVADRVTFLGPVPPEDLPRIYQAADVFVLATRNEGWANALHEAIASGLPAVATDVGGNREVLGDGVAGVIVPFGDAAALAAGIEQALGGSHDRARVAEFGGSRTWSQVGEEAAAALRSACEVRT